jgi:FMN phosphatase YigB (HAD superfamily)
MSSNSVLIFDLDDTLYQKHGVVNDDFSGMENIQLYMGAYDFLRKTTCKKVLVTKGNPSMQIKKLEILGIKDFFEEILICSTSEEKKGLFQQLKEKHPECEFWVIGDRIDSEIRFGNELGMKTVLLRKGKYAELVPKEPIEAPTYELKEFSELNSICGSPNSKPSGVSCGKTFLVDYKRGVV